MRHSKPPRPKPLVGVGVHLGVQVSFALSLSPFGLVPPSRLGPGHKHRGRTPSSSSPILVIDRASKAARGTKKAEGGYLYGRRAMAASSSSSAAGDAPSTGGGSYHHRSRFGDTTLTKVFVGGLAWETPSEGLRQHFEVYGEILEAVVINDRETGRSKGYGFVIFRHPESAARAVQDPNPMIAGRRANCNIAALGPPRQAQGGGRGRGGGGAARGPHLPDQPAMGPPYRVPSQMSPAHAAAVFYHPQYGYWYPPDYQYQQALYNSQMLQHYYPQMYGPASPSGPPYQYMGGYMSGGLSPRTGFSPMQQPARPPFFQQPTAQMEGSFPPGPSLPPNFRLRLPPHAVSTESDDASGSQSAQPTSSAAATTTSNQEASRPVTSNSDPNTPN